MHDLDQEVSSGLARIEQNIRELLQNVSAPRHLLSIQLTGVDRKLLGSPLAMQKASNDSLRLL